MEIKGSYTFDAPVEAVWDILIDPSAVARCMPGCEKLEALGDDRYRFTISAGVAAIKGRFQGTIALTDKVPQVSYQLLVDGSGTPGFIKGKASILLIPQDNKTLVTVQGDIEVGGLIARVGQRLLGTAAKTMMDRFFGCLQKSV